MNSRRDPQFNPASGRPREIEEATNRYFVHPVSRFLVDVLARTPVTPNQVSVASVAFAAAGAFCYLRLEWPWSAIVGLVALFGWHVLDGADGDLARRTGRASVSGELVDGICDHLSQLLVYVAFALILQKHLGAAAWIMAFAAGVSHFFQANAYETGRKTYRRWVYGAAWMRQGFSGANLLQRALSSLYLMISSLADPREAQVTSAMSASGKGTPTDAARRLYQDLYAPLVKRSFILSSNTRTLVGFFSMLAGDPLWFFFFEIVGLNLALVWLWLSRSALAGRLQVALAEQSQAALAPN